jgi:putative ABC transport system permease protein
MSAFLREFGQAARGLRRARGFGIVAVAVFAIGLGATSAIYTLLQRVVLDPLPYPESGRLVRVKNPVPGVDPGTEWNLSLAQLRYYADAARTLDGIGSYRSGFINVQTPDGAQRVQAALVQASVVRMLGARPVAGRMLGENDDEPGSAPVVILSRGFWQRYFGGDPGVVGRTLSINEEPYEIVGVAAAGLRLPEEPGSGLSSPPDLWMPYIVEPGRYQYSHTLPTLAHLAPGATVEQAQAEIGQLNSRLGEVYPDYYVPDFFEKMGFRTSVYSLKSYVLGDTARNLWILLGGVGLLLLIACLNVANLFLVRVEGRRREIAVRRALGAGRTTIARQFLAESTVVALLGGVLAIAIGWWGVDWLVSLAPDALPRLAELRLGPDTILFTIVLSLVMACVLALFPILHDRRSGERAVLADGGRTATSGRDRQRTRAALVATQVGLALVLLVGAGLLINSFRRLRSVDPGVRPDGVLTMELFLPASRYPDTQAAWQFYHSASERIERIPGVERVGFSEEIPFQGGYGCTVQGFADATVYDRMKEDGTTSCAGQEPTAPGYFEALGIPLIAGRTLAASDNDQPGTAAVVVSRAFADRFWPGENAVGKRVAPNGWTNQPFYNVVGVVGDVHSTSVEETPALVVYYPVVNIPSETKIPWSANYMHLVIRTSLSDPVAVFPAVREAIAGIDPSIPLANTETMGSIVDRSMGRLSFTMTLLALASIVALALAAIGLYGVISYLVTRRTRELGVRIALGAAPGQVAFLVMAGSLRTVALGIVAGTIAALALTRLMRSLLFGVAATDPLTFATAITILVAVSILASWLPVRRAARVDPMIAMQAD